LLSHVVVPILALASTVSAHGYLTIPSSRTRLNAQAGQRFVLDHVVILRIL